jgi:hypothetical protein
VSALEDIGIPIQTLHCMSELLEFPEGGGVDELADHLRQNAQAWEFTGFVDQSFVRRTLPPLTNSEVFVVLHLEIHES